MKESKIGSLLRSIGWSTRELARRWDCSERTARAWAEFEEVGPGEKRRGLQPPDMLLPWLQFISRTIEANPPPQDWRQRMVSQKSAEDGEEL